MTTRLLLSMLVPLALGGPLAAQSGARYAVKFVCGVRTLSAAPSAASIRNAVKPGTYNTAINLHNPSRDTLRLKALVATTDSAAVSGRVIPLSGGLLLPADHALELDCDDILATVEAATRRRVRFLKGFVALTGERELNVVAVYTGGPSAQLATMDVERVSPSGVAGTAGGGCPQPDFIIRTIEAGTFGNVTRFKLVVANIGGAGADSIGVQVEDQTIPPGETQANNPARITRGVIGSLGPGAEANITLDLSYRMSQADWPNANGLVDWKKAIAECVEDNNTKRVGSP